MCSTDDVLAASDGSVVVVGNVVDIQAGSGLIKRCPEADCTRVLSGGAVSTMAPVRGISTSESKQSSTDGNRSINAIFDAEATTAVSGLSLEDAQAMAMNALDTGVVVQALVERVLGRSYRLTGPVVREYFLVDDVASGPVNEDLSADTLDRPC